MFTKELQYAVRSLTRGRARIRHERLRGLDNETCANIESFLLGLEGVTGCILNPRVGSLLVTWDETKTNAEALLKSAEVFLAFLGDEPETQSTEPQPESAQADDVAQQLTNTLCEAKETLCKSLAPTVEKLTPAAKSVEKTIAAAGGAALDVLAPFVAPDQTRSGRKRRVTQNRLMLAAYLASIGILAFGSKRLHWVIGTGFTALLGVHLYQHRRVL